MVLVAIIVPMPTACLLPNASPERTRLHDEIHARPSPRIHLPAVVTMIAMLTDDVTPESEREHLRTLSSTNDPLPAASDFALLALPRGELRWERHTEFTRYVIVEPFIVEPSPRSGDADHHGDGRGIDGCAGLPDAWVRHVPGRLFAAVRLELLEAGIDDPQAALDRVRQRLPDPRDAVASIMGSGNGHSVVVTDFRIPDDGIEKMFVLFPAGTSDTRAGRVTQRLLDIEIYRMMALRGFPVARALVPELREWEHELADVTARMEARTSSESALLDRLIHAAAGTERANAQHQYRFRATRAYDAIVQQRLAELRERPIPGTPTVGEFMRRRLAPAIATVLSTEQRLEALSSHIARVDGLLRTRVDIATERQNQELLERLTRGQELQLKLQTTVEGLSIAAISYYVISLLVYGAKALSIAGVPVKAELVGGLMIPVVLVIVWRATRRVHAWVHRDEPSEHGDGRP